MPETFERLNLFPEFAQFRIGEKDVEGDYPDWPDKEVAFLRNERSIYIPLPNNNNVDVFLFTEGKVQIPKDAIKVFSGRIRNASGVVQVGDILDDAFIFQKFQNLNGSLHISVFRHESELLKFYVSVR